MPNPDTCAAGPTPERSRSCVEPHALDQAAGLELEVRAAEHRLEEAARRRPAPPTLLVDVEGARALVVAAVEIIDALDAGLLRCVADRGKQVPAHARSFDAPLAAGAVQVAGAKEMIL